MAHDIPVTQARAELAELVNRVAYSGERMILTRHGRPLAALVSAEDLAFLEECAGQRVDLTSAGYEDDAGAGGVTPMRIAATLRPEGPPRPPGFR